MEETGDDVYVEWSKLAEYRAHKQASGLGNKLKGLEYNR
jgi:hypothetical protein